MMMLIRKTVEVSSSSLKKQHLGRAFGNNVDVRLATPLPVGGIKNNGQINIPSLDPWSLIASWMWETVNINYHAVNWHGQGGVENHLYMVGIPFFYVELTEDWRLFPPFPPVFWPKFHTLFAWPRSLFLAMHKQMAHSSRKVKSKMKS